MTNQEKEYFCQLLAHLFSPPDVEMVKQIQRGNIHSFFRKYASLWRGGTDFLCGLLIEGEPGLVLKDLQHEYRQLFSDLKGEGVSLIESFYKPWTLDPRCPLPFATSKGLVMGDSALHLFDVYRQCGLEVDETFSGHPDHLVMELEFLSYLYRWATDIEIRRFIEDHLDWIPLIGEALETNHSHPLYISLSKILDLFLKTERERLERRKNGTTSIHRTNSVGVGLGKPLFAGRLRSTEETGKVWEPGKALANRCRSGKN
jgi:putative dimethyl sulfoxide reductase chaperone